MPELDYDNKHEKLRNLLSNHFSKLETKEEPNNDWNKILEVFKKANIDFQNLEFRQSPDLLLMINCKKNINRIFNISISLVTNVYTLYTREVITHTDFKGKEQKITMYSVLKIKDFENHFNIKFDDCFKNYNYINFLTLQANEIFGILPYNEEIELIKNSYSLLKILFNIDLLTGEKVVLV
jgi:hypothetical protein